MSPSLRLQAARAVASAAPVLSTARVAIAARDAFRCGHIDADPHAIHGRSVLLATRSQAAAALALLSLDGVAQRIVLVPPGLGTADLEKVAACGKIETVVCEPESWQPAFSTWPCFAVDPARRTEPLEAAQDCATEWVLLTSGTTGTPKLVVHTLHTLTGAIAQRATPPPVWGTFYDIRRYGGLQIFLRAMLGGGPLVLPDVDESADDFLARASEAGLDYLSGTPSHWRCALMGRSLDRLRLHSVRLSGEIAGQTLLDRLARCFTGAKVVHAFASTEAGVAFEVADGKEGFPATLLETTGTPVKLRVEGDTLRIRSPRMARRLLGTNVPVTGADGFVDTRDIVLRRDGRYYFGGRRDGIINSGGNKIHPEEIEALLNGHPRVEMSRARARKSPVLGAIIEADVVVREADAAESRTLEDELLRYCAATLPPHKRPTAIRLVSSLRVSAAGKLERPSV